jgi:hypothetical protein
MNYSTTQTQKTTSKSLSPSTTSNASYNFKRSVLGSNDGHLSREDLMGKAKSVFFKKLQTTPFQNIPEPRYF